MPALAKEDIRMGDKVRLRNGEIIEVYGQSDWYGDRHGRHDGPWVMVKPRGKSFERHLLADVVEVVEPNPRICRFCGEGVTATTEATDFCRNCFHNGTFLEDLHAKVIAKFRKAFPEDDVHIEHTGGGCFWLSIRPPHSVYYWCLTDGEAGLPDFAAGKGWGIVCRYCESEEDARTIPAADGKGEFWEYEGYPILESRGKDGGYTPALSHKAVIAAIKADMDEVPR